jgi:glycosyltransferase involved in cell wall biosynthesis
MNDNTIINNAKRKTVMWGVKPKKLKRTSSVKTFTILFVGLIKRSQGLEFFYSFLKTHKQYTLQVIGVSDQALYKEHQKIIKEYGIAKQVYFPNRFFSDKELNDVSKKCQVAIALYDKDPSSPTMYTDPGKVKAYLELGLPLIMSNVSAVAPYVKKFHCGEIVERNEQSIAEALKKMKHDYKKYLQGIEHFNQHFYYESYYEEKFRFLT